MPGRHAAPAGSNFYRDLLTMLGGILAVAVVVYLGLSALSNAESPGTTQSTTTTSTTTFPSTTAKPSTTTPETTTSTSAPTTTSTTVALRPPSEVRVQVLNGIGVAGLASEVTAELEALGYQTLEPDNYEPVLDQSRVWYFEDFEGEAFELAAQFPDALVELANSDLVLDADIVVVLGESYEG